MCSRGSHPTQAWRSVWRPSLDSLRPSLESLREETKLCFPLQASQVGVWVLGAKRKILGKNGKSCLVSLLRSTLQK